MSSRVYDVFSKHCCSFTVTQAGLEDQLLAMTVQKERPDLARQRSELVKQQNAFKIKIKELEDGILKRLAEAEGDITDDRELIESLEDTKRIATGIMEKSAIAQRTTVCTTCRLRLHSFFHFHLRSG